jgi:hypothetical protein
MDLLYPNVSGFNQSTFINSTINYSKTQNKLFIKMINHVKGNAIIKMYYKFK